MVVTPIVPASTPIAPFLENFIKTSLTIDDVFLPDFLSGVLVCGEDQGVDANTDLKRLLITWNNNWFRYIGTTNVPAPGPYILDCHTISPVWRVYDDPAAAFSLALRPDNLRMGR